MKKKSIFQLLGDQFGGNINLTLAINERAVSDHASDFVCDFDFEKGSKL